MRQVPAHLDELLHCWQRGLLLCILDPSANKLLSQDAASCMHADDISLASADARLENLCVYD